jgi:hypothetical protein
MTRDTGNPSARGTWYRGRIIDGRERVRVKGYREAAKQVKGYLVRALPPFSPPHAAPDLPVDEGADHRDERDDEERVSHYGSGAGNGSGASDSSSAARSSEWSAT